MNLCACIIHIILSETTINSIIIFFCLDWVLTLWAEMVVARDDRGNPLEAWVTSNGYSSPLEAETEAAYWAGHLARDWGHNNVVFWRQLPSFIKSVVDLRGHLDWSHWRVYWTCENFFTRMGDGSSFGAPGVRIKLHIHGLSGLFLNTPWCNKGFVRIWHFICKSWIFTRFSNVMYLLCWLAKNKKRTWFWHLALLMFEAIIWIIKPTQGKVEHVFHLIALNESSKIKVN